MSTRSMTILESDHGVRIYLCRHCDGYPAGAGVALFGALENTGPYAQAAHAARALLSRPGDYELADWTPDDQGDLEHVYHATYLLERDTWTVTHYARSRWRDGDTAYLSWPSASYGLADFGVMVDREAAALNRRAAEYAKRQAQAGQHGATR